MGSSGFSVGDLSDLHGPRGFRVAPGTRDPTPDAPTAPAAPPSSPRLREADPRAKTRPDVAVGHPLRHPTVRRAPSPGGTRSAQKRRRPGSHWAQVRQTCTHSKPGRTLFWCIVMVVRRADPADSRRAARGLGVPTGAVQQLFQSLSPQHLFSFEIPLTI